jgi:Tol biopolymer transport system component
MPDLQVSRNSNPFRFTRDGKALVVLQGGTWAQDFWRLDLATSRLTRLTDLAPGFATRSFDISPDDDQILFDRFRDNADLTLIELPRR